MTKASAMKLKQGDKLFAPRLGCEFEVTGKVSHCARYAKIPVKTISPVEEFPLVDCLLSHEVFPLVKGHDHV